MVALEKDSNVCSKKRDRLKSQEWPDDSAVMFLKSLTSQVRWAWVGFGDHVETHALFAIVQNLYQAMPSCGMFSSSIGFDPSFPDNLHFLLHSSHIKGY